MTPLVIAHRGACWDAPENTPAAFELAVDQGADYVEFDVRLAPDGRLVLHHDPLPDPCPPDLPTLDETLALLDGRIGLAVEIKEEAAAEPTMRALRAHRIDSASLVVLSFDACTLEAARRLAPDVRLVLNCGRRADPAAATDFWGLSFHNAIASPEQIRLAQSFDLATFVFTVNKPPRMLELAELGVDGIFTDRPALLRETLAARLAT